VSHAKCKGRKNPALVHLQPMRITDFQTASATASAGAGGSARWIGRIVTGPHRRSDGRHPKLTMVDNPLDQQEEQRQQCEQAPVLTLAEFFPRLSIDYRSADCDLTGHDITL